MKQLLTHYQRRVTKFIWAARAYSVGGLLFLLFQEDVFIGAMVLITGCVILYGMAVLSDAVFDSLNERINIQSAWLACRLDAIEQKSSIRIEETGQVRWITNGVPTDHSNYYFDTFPERFSAEDQRQAWKLIEEKRKSVTNPGARH